MVREGKDGRFYIYKRAMRPLIVRGILSAENKDKITKVFKMGLEKKYPLSVELRGVNFPKGFEGKSVQFVVEVVEEKKPTSSSPTKVEGMQ